MNRIAELRKKHGISQVDLAKHLRIAQNTLSQYENEVRKPTVNIITEIANFFDVSTNYVLGFAEPQERSIDGQNFSLNQVTVMKTFHYDAQIGMKEINLYLAAGWKLLHIGTEAELHYDGSGYSGTLYTLGWYGDPDKANVADFETPGDEYMNYV